MRRLFVYGGLVAGVVLLAFGIASIVIGISGRNEVNNNLKNEKIVGTPDMTPQTIRAAAQQAGLQNVPLPTCTIAGQTVNSGSRANCFGQYMRVQALIGTGGRVFSQIPQYASADGKGTNDATAAVQQNGRPVPNPARTVWVSYTALSGNLNLAYLGDKLGLFSIIMGICLLLTGIGLIVLDVALLARSVTPREVGAPGGAARAAPA